MNARCHAAQAFRRPLPRHPRGPRGQEPAFTRARGLALIDCLAYIGILALILGMAFLAYYRATDYSRDLSANAAEILRAVNAGERWREDVRTATGAPRFEENGGVATLDLPHPGGAITYSFREGAIHRRALPNTNWMPLLSAVTVSAMRPEARRHVTNWHWDLELKGRQKLTRLRPVFSFEAVHAVHTMAKP